MRTKLYPGFICLILNASCLAQEPRNLRNKEREVVAPITSPTPLNSVLVPLRNGPVLTSRQRVFNPIRRNEANIRFVNVYGVVLKESNPSSTITIDIIVPSAPLTPSYRGPAVRWAPSGETVGPFSMEAYDRLQRPPPRPGYFYAYSPVDGELLEVKEEGFSSPKPESKTLQTDGTMQRVFPRRSPPKAEEPKAKPKVHNNHQTVRSDTSHRDTPAPGRKQQVLFNERMCSCCKTAYELPHEAMTIAAQVFLCALGFAMMFFVVVTLLGGFLSKTYELFKDVTKTVARGLTDILIFAWALIVVLLHWDKILWACFGILAYRLLKGPIVEAWLRHAELRRKAKETKMCEVDRQLEKAQNDLLEEQLRGEKLRREAQREADAYRREKRLADARMRTEVSRALGEKLKLATELTHDLEEQQFVHDANMEDYRQAALLDDIDRKVEIAEAQAKAMRSAQDAEARSDDHYLDGDGPMPSWHGH